MIKSLRAKSLVTAGCVLVSPVVTMEDGYIVKIASGEGIETTHITYDFPDEIITAGLLDIHFHGAAGHDVMEGTQNSMDTVSAYLARAGVTQFLPTTVTAALDTTLRALDGIATSIERGPSAGAAMPVGIHIEGPFLSHAKRGMHPAEHLLPPTPDLLRQLWEASRGQIRLMTIAPEQPGALETIRYAVSLGIRCSIGHSAATRDEALAGIDAGATTATHTFNAMRAFDHREPGILGVVLDRDDLYADLICDGLHVAPEAVRLWLKAKGPERAILITDCLEASGMPDGTYKLGQTVIRVQGPRAVTEEGVLAGSIITLDRAVENLRQMTGADLPTAVRLASTNPASMLGLPDRLVPGAPADFNVYDDRGNRKALILRGNLLNE